MSCTRPGGSARPTAPAARWPANSAPSSWAIPSARAKSSGEPPSAPPTPPPSTPWAWRWPAGPSWDAAAAHFARCLELDGGFFGDIQADCFGQLGRPDLAVTLAAGNPDRLWQVASRLEAQSADNVQARARASGRSTNSPPLTTRSNGRVLRPDSAGGPLFAMGLLARQQKDLTTAADCMRRAVSKRIWAGRMASPACGSAGPAGAIRPGNTQRASVCAPPARTGPRGN